jgi:hypothetical protein
MDSGFPRRAPGMTEVSRRIQTKRIVGVLQSRASLLFFRHGVTLFGELFELLLLLSDALGCSFFILGAGRRGGLFNQLSDIVSKYRDAVVEFG